MPASRLEELLSLPRPLFLDGAMGTMLQARGMPAGVSPERFCLARPDVLRGVHREYLEAGSDIVLSCTFGANPFKLDPTLDVFEFNKTMAEAAREAAAGLGRPVCVAGDVGPSGHFARPLGDVDPEEMIAGYEKQMRGLAAGGCDLILIETQFDVAEARAAVIAARRACDLPVAVSMTFEQGMSLTGSTPAIFAETMLNLGCALVGTNCSLGPDLMAPVVKELLETCDCPVFAEPNAGMPELRGTQTVFPLGPERFAELTAPFARMGVRILGGCCGTTPEHIRCLRQAVSAIELRSPEVTQIKRPGIVLTTRQSLVRIGADSPFVLIGERINPTGKKQLTADLQQGVFTTALDFAEQQTAMGAHVLDVNVGAHGVDQMVFLPKMASLLTSKYTCPLSLDSSDMKAIMAALPWCPGSPLVNSVSGESERMQVLGSACRDQGAPFILLPLRGRKLPVMAKERIAILESLLREAEDLRIPRRLIVVDILALAVSANMEASAECLKFASWCRENGFATIIGLSNTSFGLPARELINATFLSMAAACGLTSCIANPSAQRVREAIAATDVLRGLDPNAGRFVSEYANWKSSGGSAAGGTGGSGQAGASGAGGVGGKGGSKDSYDAVLRGDREHVEALIDKDLADGLEPFQLVNEKLIPAITEVGGRYERKEYFLPQLIRSAETMQAGFAHVKPLLRQDAAEERPAIVMATVEGDIHDIGKNIVCLLLGNHGFNVIDAGKDVPAEEIVRVACEHKASIIGLSALMTTTMVRMEDTIRLIRERNLPIRVMVGGAAVTKAFADSIGADAYCVDAVEAVAAAKRLV